MLLDEHLLIDRVKVKSFMLHLLGELPVYLLVSRLKFVDPKVFFSDKHLMVWAFSTARQKWRFFPI